MGWSERLLASFEETESLPRPASPLTGSRLWASWSWAQGSCELPTAKPRTRSPSYSAPRRLIKSKRPSWPRLHLRIRPHAGKAKPPASSTGWLKPIACKVVPKWLKKWYRDSLSLTNSVRGRVLTCPLTRLAPSLAPFEARPPVSAVHSARRNWIDIDCQYADGPGGRVKDRWNREAVSGRATIEQDKPTFRSQLMSHVDIKLVHANHGIVKHLDLNEMQYAPKDYAYIYEANARADLTQDSSAAGATERPLRKMASKA